MIYFALGTEKENVVEDPPVVDESREERCGLTALGVINHRLLAEFRHRSPGTFGELEVCYTDLFCLCWGRTEKHAM